MLATIMAIEGENDISFAAMIFNQSSKTRI